MFLINYLNIYIYILFLQLHSIKYMLSAGDRWRAVLQNQQTGSEEGEGQVPP